MRTSEQINAQLELIRLELIIGIDNIMKNKQVFILDNCLLESDKGAVFVSITDQHPICNPLVIVENISDGEQSETDLSDLTLADLVYILEQLEN